MGREQGKDPTPQGRQPGRDDPAIHLDETPHLADTEAEKNLHSTPGPAVRRDGAYFLGRKKERD